MSVAVNDHEVFYDTETTGPDPVFDQVLQYAAIRTDGDFNEIDAIDERSQLLPYVVPTPGALKVTHVNPYDIARAPRGPFAFAQHIAATLTQWSAGGLTDFSGWNTLAYDEEIKRRMFWTNLLDPYMTSGKNRRRVDYLPMTRALAARNPDIITIPIKEETGKPNFKLENIATANGFTGHNAHDALGDVRATIHMARLIRETDPSLFFHIKSMGLAQNAVEFVEEEQIFRIIGGAMVTPGILDVCHIANDPENPKAKTAWNLSVDPTPFLTMTPEEILDAMRKTGTPFRSVKCHKMPLIFPTGWEFLRHASGTDAPTPDLITTRSQQVIEHKEFRANVVEALRLKTAGYEPNVHLEQKIYSGFPSWADKTRMKDFHNAPTWEKRLTIARSFENGELQSIGLRLVWANAPEVLSPDHRSKINDHIGATRLGLLLDQPWTTVGSFMAELEEWEEQHEASEAEEPDEELAIIRQWVMETYPAARDWVPGTGKVAKAAKEAEEAAAKEASKADKAAAKAAQDAADKIAAEAPQAPAGTGATLLAEPHFLDGIED